MEEKRNTTTKHLKGKASDPRLPDSGGVIPIAQTLIEEIQELENEIKNNGQGSKLLREKVVKTAFKYLVHIGVHSTLLQYGEILDENDNDTGKQFLFAGSYALKNMDEIFYHELGMEKDIFSAVILGKSSELPK